MKQQSTYADIIEDKIQEWQSKLEELRLQSEQASPEQRPKLDDKMNNLRTAIEIATLQLHDLDARETMENTLNIKDDILRIFETIDRDLQTTERVTPYML